MLYVEGSALVISVVMISKKGENGMQNPIYYLSRALQGAECRYPPIEKLALVVVTAARLLCPYFQAHIINIPIGYPLLPGVMEARHIKGT